MQNLTQRTLGMRLKEARRRREMSQKTVAVAIGIHEVTVSKYERDVQDPNTTVLADLARLYDVSIDWLVAEHEDFIHYGFRSTERVMRVAISLPTLTLRVHEDALSEVAIAELKELVEYVLWREKKRRGGEAGRE